MRYIIDNFIVKPGKYRFYSSLQHIFRFNKYTFEEYDIYFMCNGMDFKYNCKNEDKSIIYDDQFIHETVDQISARLSNTFNLNLKTGGSLKDISNFDSIFQTLSMNIPVIIFINPKSLFYLKRDFQKNTFNNMYSILLYGLEMDKKNSIIGDTFVVDNSGKVSTYSGDFPLYALKEDAISYLWCDFRKRYYFDDDFTNRNVIYNLEIFLDGNHNGNYYRGNAALIKCWQDFSMLCAHKVGNFENYCLKLAYMLKEYFLPTVDYLNDFLEVRNDTMRIISSLDEIKMKWNQLYHRLIKIGCSQSDELFNRTIIFGENLIKDQERIFNEIYSHACR